MDSIQEIWTDIETWYKGNTPRLYRMLRAGASDRQIRRLERRIGLALPEDYIDSLRRHNGGSFIDNYLYLGIDEVLERWAALRDVLRHERFQDDEEISDSDDISDARPGQSALVPIAEHIAGVIVCVSLTPISLLTKGIIVEIDISEGTWTSAYETFTDWLESYRDDLYQDLYKIDENGYLLPK